MTLLIAVFATAVILDLLFGHGEGGLAFLILAVSGIVALWVQVFSG